MQRPSGQQDVEAGKATLGTRTGLLRQVVCSAEHCVQNLGKAQAQVGTQLGFVLGGLQQRDEVLPGHRQHVNIVW